MSSTRRHAAVAVALGLVLGGCDLQVEQDPRPLVETLGDPAPDDAPTPTGTEPEPSPEPSRSPTDDPTGDASEEPSEEPSDEPTQGPSQEPTPSPTPTPSPSPTPSPTSSPTPTPSPSPSPTPSPTPTPTPSPTATNEAPITADDRATTGVGQAVTIDVLANDRDPEGDPLDLADIGEAANGRAVIDGNRVTYTPNAGFVGTDSFTYNVSDGTNTSTGRVTVVVERRNSAPTAADDGPYDVKAGSSVLLNVMANDRDPDGDPLTIEILSAPSLGTATAESGGIRYQHNPRATGATDRLTYRVVDPSGARSGTATVTIRIV